jgi:RimK family alpha-L-glutamate ligase
MKIGIVALKRLENSTVLPMFKQASKKLDVELEFYHPSDIIIKVKEGEVRLLNRNRKKIILDGAVNWIPYPNYEELDDAFTLQSIPYINSSRTVRLCRNKMLTNLKLSESDINQPHTEYYMRLGENPKTLPMMQVPFIYKNKCGSHGRGAEKFDRETQIKDFLNKRKRTSDLYFQRYIKNFGSDYRVIVVGGKVIGGIEKSHNQDEWRTHVAYGAKVEAIKVSGELKRIAIETARAVDAHFCGVDIMKGVDDKLYLLEANAVPGMNIFHDETGINIGEAILKHLVEVVNNGDKVLSDGAKKKR